MKFIFFIAATIAAFGVSAQAPIVRQNGSTISLYNSVPAAVTAANNGDTIYIPGGNWNLGGSLYINKQLHIFGTGHHPDSSQASGITFLTSGDIVLQQGCSNGSLWGIFNQGQIMYSNSGDSIVNYSIRRCRFQGNVFFPNKFSLSLISENIFQSNVLSANSFGANNNAFLSNIFEGCVYYFGSGNVFRNNIFFYPGTCAQLNDCLFENNIFLSTNSVMSGSSNGIFNNNIFTTNVTFPSGTNLGNNNIVNQIQSSIFVNQSGVIFNYAHNYQLQTTSPGNNAGTDGTDIGIYGGMFPWKDGSVPPNPHILFKSIAPTTDVNGNLQINIKVKAQQN